MSLNVVQLPVSNLGDIPAMLRKLADDIEADHYGETTAAIAVIETNDNLFSFGWGDAGDSYHNIGLLEAAKAVQLGIAMGETD